jgi:hypothetical protein
VGAKHACDPSASSASPSPRRLSASPTRAAASLVTALRTPSPNPSPSGPVGPLVSTTFPFSLWCLAVEPWTRAGLVRRGQPEHSHAAALATV